MGLWIFQSCGFDERFRLRILSQLQIAWLQQVLYTTLETLDILIRGFDERLGLSNRWREEASSTP